MGSGVLPGGSTHPGKNLVGLKVVHQPTLGWFASTFCPMLPLGPGGPSRWTPGTISGGPGGPGTLPVTPETFLVSKTIHPIYQYLPPDHSGAPRDVRDLIRDSEQLSVTSYNNSL